MLELFACCLLYRCLDTTLPVWIIRNILSSSLPLQSSTPASTPSPDVNWPLEPSLLPLTCSSLVSSLVNQLVRYLTYDVIRARCICLCTAISLHITSAVCGMALNTVWLLGCGTTQLSCNTIVTGKCSYAGSAISLLMKHHCLQAD